jgi:co-chaperonin GroES (HSP10)
MATALTQTKKQNNTARSLYSSEQKEFTPEEQIAIDEAFPAIDPGFVPNGNRVLIQVRRPKTKTKGGILLTEQNADVQLYDEQVGRVVAIGQAAFRNPADMTTWAEDPWFDVGDFVRFPKFGGDKTWTVSADGESTLFIVFREFDTIGRIYCNPLDIKGAY